jgi:ligand-binding sensor domain-containing protein
MNKLLTAIICFAITACNSPSDRLTTAEDTLQNSRQTKQTRDTSNHAFATLFAANRVAETGRAINQIYQDTKNNFWFASNSEGVFVYDGHALFQFTTSDGLSDNQVFSIQEDRQGNIWFVTVAGISRFDGKNVTTHPSPKNDTALQNNTATENLWFEFGGGAYHFNGHTFSYLLLPKPDLTTTHTNTTNPQKPDARQLNAFSVYCSFKDRNENIWFGTQTLGVCRYDGKNFSWLGEKGLAGPAVRALFQDSKGGFWFGNNGNGLFHYDGTVLTNVTEVNKLDNPTFVKTGKAKQGTLARVWSVNEDNAGNIWIATCDSGVWRYDGKTFTNYTAKDGLTSNAVNTIYKDKSGQLWFGTDGAGVCVLNGNSFSAFVPPVRIN